VESGTREEPPNPALWFSTGHAAHGVSGGILFAMGAVGIGLQGWHAIKRLRGDRGK
jgi:hypothetical protein